MCVPLASCMSQKEFSSYVFSVVQLCVETLVKQKVQNHLKFMRLLKQCLPSQATDVRNAGCLFYVRKKKPPKTSSPLTKYVGISELGFPRKTLQGLSALH